MKKDYIIDEDTLFAITHLAGLDCCEEHSTGLVFVSEEFDEEADMHITYGVKNDGFILKGDDYEVIT